MKPRKILLFIGIAIGLWLLTRALPALAAPNAQLTPFPTPTPGPDGRIIYIVQQDDTLWRISAVTGISIDQIRALNNLGSNDVVRPGQALLLGIGAPIEPTPTPGPTPTPAPPTPTATPGTGTGWLCVFVYEDLNGDSLRQDDEPALPGAAISIIARGGKVSLDSTMQVVAAESEGVMGEDPNCFESLPEGDYNISIAVPEEYNPTTVMNYPLRILPGEQNYLSFGAQIASALPETAPETSVSPPSDTPSSNWIGIAGGLLLLSGLALGVYAMRFSR